MRLARLSLIAVALFAAGRLEAQGYFGQNQVQFDTFRWKVIETDHFLVHYYPEEREAVMNAARMAERSYARLSRLLNHDFREKKPLILYASRGDFGQNNVLGDLGEGTGGVTEALRHRIMLPFTGDYRSFEHVLQHELVHAFQYDIFARGRAGGGLQTLQQVQPPLWFMEGMAEYLSLGPGHVLTQAWVRDAALNGSLPTIEQMTDYPDRFFPYRYGEALWEYVGKRWGDEVIGAIMQSVPNVGIERAFKRELGLSLEELSDEWREAMQVKHLPQIAQLDRARKFSEVLLSERKSGGNSSLFLAPALSNDGKLIAFIAQGSFFRGEVFPDLWLGDGETGKRIKRLVKSTLDPDFEELRLLYSQSAFSPDGKYLAFTAQREGRDVLYLLDVRSRKTLRHFSTPLEGITGPSFSPDSRQIVFSGGRGGLTDLYIINVDGSGFRQLTNDAYAELQPNWSPDGKTVAFVTDRGGNTDFDLLRFDKWKIGTIDVATGRIDVIPAQNGLNLNPQWAPDGKSLAFVSDRTGIANIFLYDFDAKEHFQLTKVVGTIGAITEYSPAITWARQADRLAFTYFEDGDYTVWSVSNPRRLKGQPFRPIGENAAPVVAAVSPADSVNRTTRANEAEGMLRAIETAARAADSTRDTTGRRTSVYRSSSGIRPSEDTPAAAERGTVGPVSVAQLLDSASLALPDTTRFREYDYKSGFQPEYIAQPSIGYTQDNYGRGVYGGTAIVLSDLLGNKRLAFAGQINGRIDEAQLYAAYTNLGSRTQYTFGALQSPTFFLNDYTVADFQQGDPSRQIETYEIARYIARQGFVTAMRPLNRFTRFEFGLGAYNIDRSSAFISRGIDYNQGFATDFRTDSIVRGSNLSYGAPFVAYVSDNTLFGYTAPISGRRFRFQVEPAIGQLRWTEFTADYRRYVPLIFNFITFAWRVQTNVAVGPDELSFPKYIGRPDFIRGYDREQFSSQFCGGVINDRNSCSATELLGSRVAFANAELRFPLVRRFDLGLIPISLPPVDGLFFYDAGAAWSSGQSISFRKPEGYNEDENRYFLRSYGAGIRLNLFGFALVRWDYSIPLDRPSKKGYWMWTLGQSF